MKTVEKIIQEKAEKYLKRKMRGMRRERREPKWFNVEIKQSIKKRDYNRKKWNANKEREREEYHLLSEAQKQVAKKRSRSCNGTREKSDY